jgi:hypothetical protein
MPAALGNIRVKPAADGRVELLDVGRKTQKQALTGPTTTVYSYPFAESRRLASVGRLPHD